MNLHQMSKRCPTARASSIASLSDYQFVINARGVATIVPLQWSQVHGLVWNVSAEDWRRLDKLEGVQSGHYRRQTVTLRARTGASVEAIAYVATNTTPGPPREGYLERILEGGRAARLPEDYLRDLKSWATLARTGD
jgi:gamma-glutamylcyclotransferase (GGCT)/AIG2-like uncharacterized protein YtfP